MFSQKHVIYTPYNSTCMLELNVLHTLKQYLVHLNLLITFKYRVLLMKDVNICIRTICCTTYRVINVVFEEDFTTLVQTQQEAEPI